MIQLSFILQLLLQYKKSLIFSSAAAVPQVEGPQE